MGAFPLEELVLADADVHVQVAGADALTAGFSLTGQADAGAVIHAGRDGHLQAAFPLHRADAAAGAAGVADGAALPVACRAGALDREEALLCSDLSGTTASAAGRGFLVRIGRSATRASLARYAGRHAERGFGAGEGFLQGDFHRLLDVVALARAPSVAGHLAEHLFEDIAQPAAGVEIEPGRLPAAALFERGMAEPVVGGALLIVLQNVVCLTEVLEFRLGLFVPRIAIRVILHGELAVRLLQVVR